MTTAERILTTGAVTGLQLAVCTTVKSAGLVTVKIGSKSVQAQCPQDLTVAVKDPVLIGRVGHQYYIVQRYYSAIGNVDALSDGTIYEPPSSPCTITASTTFLPKRTATYRGSSWRTDSDDMWQGQEGSQGLMTGCAFYGPQITNALAGATVLSAHLKAKRLTGGAHSRQTATLVHVTEQTKPSGAPTTGGSYTGPAILISETLTKIIVDTSLVQALVDGTYGGIGIHIAGNTPVIRLAGLSHYSGAFALTIDWQRST